MRAHKPGGSVPEIGVSYNDSQNRLLKTFASQAAAAGIVPESLVGFNCKSSNDASSPTYKSQVLLLYTYVNII
jgi:hypothetical protein